MIRMYEPNLTYFTSKNFTKEISFIRKFYFKRLLNLYLILESMPYNSFLLICFFLF